MKRGATTMSAKIKILYIDDYDLDRELVRDVLEKDHGGFELFEASNKQEFEALFNANRFDVVLSDFNIAGFEGLQVIETVKARDPRIPVIIVTGTGSEEIAVKALKLGANDYVIKRPKHIQRLPQTILSEIEKQKLRDQRRLSEISLKESEEKFRNIAENSIVGIYIVQDGVFNYINPKFAEIFGYPADAYLIGRPFRQIVYPEDYALVQEQVRKRSSGEAQSVRYTFRGVKKDGNIIHVEIFGSGFQLNGKFAATGTILDITARKAVESERGRLMSAIEQLSEIVVITDPSGVIQFANPAIFNITGYSVPEVMGQTPRFFKSGRHDRAFYEKLWNTILSGASWTGRIVNRRKDGSFYTAECSISPVINRQGAIANFVWISRDITKAIETEKRLQRIQRLESIGNIAGGIAHDFNNILTSIIGFTGMALEEAPKDSSIEDCLLEVYTAGKRAKELVQQILVFARKSEDESKPIRIDLLVTEVLKFIRSSIPSTIEIRQTIESDSLIMGNATQIHQILMNLCTNATHAMEETGGILKVTMEDVVIDLWEADGNFDLPPGKYIQIVVSDTGTGIAPEIIGAIFEPYFTTKEAGEGTGMGLALVYGIVDSYGGAITVDSALGKGAAFTIHLPITSERQPPAPPEPRQLPTGRERILLVDDEAPIAKVSSQMLSGLGYAVTTTTGSQEALDLFRAHPDDFDLVITDMTMPHMTGDRLATELIAIRPGIPIILHTGYNKKISDLAAKQIGIKAFAYKPVLKADLARIVRNALDEASAPDHR